MSDKQEQDPFEELRVLFDEAAARVSDVWKVARRRSEEAKHENEVYRELMTYGSAAVDALTRAAKMAWENVGRK
jgi:hypothetical protein